MSRKEYVTWKYAISNLCSFSYMNYLLDGKKNYKGDKTKHWKTPFGKGSSSFSFLDSCHTGREGQVLLSAPYQRQGRIKPKTAVVRPMGSHRNEHRVTWWRKIDGLDKDLMVHCPSVQRFGCNFWPNWKTAALFSIICRLKGGPVLEQHVFRGFGSR